MRNTMTQQPLDDKAQLPNRLFVILSNAKDPGPFRLLALLWEQLLDTAIPRCVQNDNCAFVKKHKRSLVALSS